MKKFAALLMILSVSVFTVGCGKTDSAKSSSVAPAKSGSEVKSGSEMKSESEAPKTDAPTE
jgi:hypothetical protein